MADAAPGLYRGEMKEQLRHGYGRYIYPNSFFEYEGEWKEGKKHGHGKLLFKDGSYYEGEFVDGEIVGNGFRYWAHTGNTYSGQFLYGELHGHGVMQYKDGQKYEGDFCYGVREGHGLLTGKDGQRYEGSFYKNKRHGGGKMRFKNGDEYEGDWILNQRQGHGLLHCVDGTVYEGQWRNDTFNGQGSIIHCSNVIYDGHWLNGYPVAQPKKMVILGPEVIDTVPGSAHTFHVQLQNEEGDVIECESGRLLEISAGVRDGELLASSKNSLYTIMELIGKKPIQSPFGFQYISYPLMAPNPESQEPQAAVSPHRKSLLGLPELLVPKGDVEPESESTPLDSARDTLSNQDGMEDHVPCLARLQRAECGSAIFSNVILAPPSMDILLTVQLDDPPETVSPRKTRRRKDKAHAEKVPTSLESIAGSRSRETSAGSKTKLSQTYPKDAVTLPGEYVIMVHEVTSPPFMGQLLPPAFRLLRILPEKVLPEDGSPEKVVPSKGKNEPSK
ncbi:MORN repeat-containing protein 1 [Heteronotia binoei]|uniref:MORN repeat-containing protein 1 n=1 Tax=Heteronotia binoei TaxID=13085 RepID=UPI00292FFB0C|nr:MORN repeat-containing protein 1 [Heteronotia binoei]